MDLNFRFLTMKKFTLKNTILTLAFFAAATLQSQNYPPTMALVSDQDKIAVNAVNGQAKTSASTCTDMVNYVGNVSNLYVKVGGVGNNFYKIAGVFQVYPAYKGTVTGVQFNAAKWASNVTVHCDIYGVDMFGQPDYSIQYAASSVLVNSVNNTLYTVNFTTPAVITATTGFSIGFYCNNSTDSVKAFTGPAITGWTTNYSYAGLANGNMYTWPQYTGLNTDYNTLFRPIITTSMSTNMVSARTSTGCGIPAVFGFTNNSGPAASYSANAVINPQGITRSLDYGDGSPLVSIFTSPKIYTYTAVGTYTASFTQTYAGWTNSCVDTKTLEIQVDDPQPSFTYTVSGLNVTFSNTSQGLGNNYVWNFGDLTTSTQENPGTHTFSGLGTYVVELEGTASCGKVKYTVSIVVTGLTENRALNELIKVYPNPANIVLNVDVPASKNDLKIEIYNPLGALVKSVTLAEFNGNSASVDISNLSKGIYMIKFKNTNATATKTFVKD